MQHSILIADDEKVSLHLIVNYLKRSDKKFIIYKANNGKEAVKMARNYIPDIILMDWSMPIMNGTEAIKILKDDYRTKNIPIILQTSVSNSAFLKEALAAGAVDFIRKPFEKIELMTRINSALLLHHSIKEAEFNKKKVDTHTDELNKLTLIIKQTDNSVIVMSPTGDIEWANNGFSKLYGLTLPEFIEKYDINLLKATSHKELIERKFEKLLETKKSVTYVTHCRKGGCEGKWIQTTLTPVFDGDQIEKIVAIEADITKAKQNELILINKNKEMKQLTEELFTTNKELEKQKNIILEERDKTNELLSNILPHHIAAQLKSIGYARPRNYRRSTIMFTDFKGFTRSCENLTPDQIVNFLHEFFIAFDEIVTDHFIEKIKTIGDAYMCAGGLPLRNRSNPFDVVIAGLKIQHFMKNRKELKPEANLPDWNLRLGIHTGPVVAGVVGKIKFAYDIWGDSVNIASRMESSGEVGRVNISGSTYKYIKNFFDCEYRGEIEIKNRGKINMYFVNGIKEEYSEDDSKVIPNEEFRKHLNSL